MWLMVADVLLYFALVGLVVFIYSLMVKDVWCWFSRRLSPWWRRRKWQAEVDEQMRRADEGLPQKWNKEGGEDE